MKLSYIDRRIAVYDDFLSTHEHGRVLSYFESAKFRNVLPEAWGRGYRLNDGNPLVGTQIVSESRGPGEPNATFPTHTALDVVVERVQGAKSMIEDIVGPFGKSWTMFSMTPYIYPVASSLGWHTDGHCAGAYIYYAHLAWNAHWGGELAVERVDEDFGSRPSSSRGIVPNESLEMTLKNGIGNYFAPTPNRLIVMRGGTPHTVKRVEAAAGDHLRLSLSGFFFRPEDSRQTGEAGPQRQAV